jgi:hypothetical protein
MSRLLEIQANLQDTTAAIAQLEKEAMKDPKSPSLNLIAMSLEKRQKVLESDFWVEANALGIDVCTYHILGEHERQPLRALVQALGDFQIMVSTVYDAVKSRVPKTRARITPEIAAETEFRFAYTFPGSLGVVLTIPNQRLLGIESHLDESILEIAKMAKAQDTSEVLAFAKRLGPASVRTLYRWAFDHDTLGIGANIEWRREHNIRSRSLTQQPEFERLHKTIEQTSDQTIEERKVIGLLEGADIIRKSFRIKTDTGEDIRGLFTDAISEEQTVELPKRYRAIIITKEQIKYSTEEEIISHQLVKLEPILE